MGCWNKTCMVSNLHITAGQEVVVFLLKEENRNNNYDYCYINSYFVPCLLPFYGKYNDYGSVENCHGEGLNLLIEKVRENLVELEQGENEYHDIPAKKETFDIDQLFELDHEQRLFVSDKYDKHGKYMLTHVQIHKDIFDYIIENFKFKDYKSNHSFDDVIKFLPDYISGVQEQIKLHEPIGPYSFREEILSLNYNQNNLVAKYIYSFIRDNQTFGSFKVLTIDMFEKMETDKLQLLLTDILKGVWINLFLHETRKPWIKTIGEGSQSCSHNGYRVLNKAIENVLNKEEDEENELNNDG
jgi:hypothetical protein